MRLYPFSNDHIRQIKHVSGTTEKSASLARSIVAGSCDGKQYSRADWHFDAVVRRSKKLYSEYWSISIRKSMQLPVLCEHWSCVNTACCFILINTWGVVSEVAACQDHKRLDGARVDSYG